MQSAAAVTVSAPLPLASVESNGARLLLAAFLSGRNERTAESYRTDLADFAAWLGMSAEDAACTLLQNHGQANQLAHSYRAHLSEGFAAATVNRRLSALRSLVKLANTFGRVNWNLTVPNMKASAYRDTRGPGRDDFTLLLRAAADQKGMKGLRDVAMLRLLRDVAMRRGEVVGLDFSDVDMPGSRIAVLGKGRTEKEWITLPLQTKAALAAWLEARGREEGPLFTNLDRARKGSGRIAGASLHAIVQTLGKTVGLRLWPHALRHAGITLGLDLSHGDLRSVQKFSRHKDVRTLQIYDDNRTDLAGNVAALVAAA